jgi:hypothetical protein
VTTRRLVLAAGALAPGVALARPHRSSRDIDARLKAALDDPSQRLEVRARLFGSTARATVHRVSHGHVWGWTPEEAQLRPLFSVINYAVAEWAPDPAGGYASRSFDSAVYCRFGTLEPLETFDNPYTGAPNRPVSFLLGPMSGRMTAAALATGGEAVARPRDLPLQVHGGMLTWPISSSRLVKNPLDRAAHPASWGGPELAYELFAAFTADGAALLDRSAPQALATSRYDEMTPWPYWMEMGDRPGRLVAHGSGVKLASLDAMDVDVRRVLEAGVPAMFDRSGWTTPRNDLTEFLRAR